MAKDKLNDYEINRMKLYVDEIYSMLEPIYKEINKNDYVSRKYLREKIMGILHNVNCIKNIVLTQSELTILKTSNRIEKEKRKNYNKTYKKIGFQLSAETYQSLNDVCERLNITKTDLIKQELEGLINEQKK